MELYPLDHSDFVTFCRFNTALLFDTEVGGGGGGGAGAGAGAGAGGSHRGGAETAAVARWPRSKQFFINLIVIAVLVKRTCACRNVNRELGLRATPTQTFNIYCEVHLFFSICQCFKFQNQNGVLASVVNRLVRCRRCSRDSISAASSCPLGPRSSKF